MSSLVFGPPPATIDDFHPAELRKGKRPNDIDVLRIKSTPSVHDDIGIGLTDGSHVVRYPKNAATPIAQYDAAAAGLGLAPQAVWPVTKQGGDMRDGERQHAYGLALDTQPLVTLPYPLQSYRPASSHTLADLFNTAQSLTGSDDGVAAQMRTFSDGLAAIFERVCGKRISQRDVRGSTNTDPDVVPVIETLDDVLAAGPAVRVVRWTSVDGCFANLSCGVGPLHTLLALIHDRLRQMNKEAMFQAHFGSLIAVYEKWSGIRQNDTHTNPAANIPAAY